MLMKLTQGGGGAVTNQFDHHLLTLSLHNISDRHKQNVCES
jgi:hypothetical protein